MLCKKYFVKRIKRQVIDKQKIFLKHILDKIISSKIHSEF